MDAQTYYRQMHKPRIRIIRPECCPRCNFELNASSRRYWFTFGNLTACARSFADICCYAKAETAKHIAGNYYA